MSTEAIVTAIIMWAVFIVGLTWCFSKWRRGGSEWDD